MCSVALDVLSTGGEEKMKHGSLICSDSHGSTFQVSPPCISDVVGLNIDTVVHVKRSSGKTCSPFHMWPSSQEQL